MYKNHPLKSLANTQAAGAIALGNKSYEYLPHHQIQIEVSSQPSAGSLAIEIKTPGATEYVAVSGSPIDLTTLNKAAIYRLDNCFVESFRFTPTSFDADKTYNIHIQSNE